MTGVRTNLQSSVIATKIASVLEKSHDDRKVALILIGTWWCVIVRCTYHFTKELSFKNSLRGSNELHCSLFVPYIEHVSVLGVPRHTEHSLPLLWLHTESDRLHGALRATRVAVEGHLRHTSITGEENHPHAAGFLCLLKRGRGGEVYYCKWSYMHTYTQFSLFTMTHTYA